MSKPLDGVRVCMLLYNPFTHDSRVLKEGRSLIAAGADVRLVAQAGHDVPDREVIDGIRVVRAPFDPLPSRIVRRVVARRRGVPVDSEPVVMLPSDDARGVLHELELAVRRVLVGVTYAHWYRQIIRTAREESFDLVVAHDFETLPAASWLARRTGARLIYDAHEMAAEQRQIVERTKVGAARQHWVESRLARRADAVITVNDTIAYELARRLGIQRPGVVRNAPYAPKPVEAAHAAWRSDLGLPEGRRVVLYLGGLVEHRGLEDMIAATALVEHVDFVLMGPARPAYIEQLRDAARAAGVAERVHFMPAVPSSEVPAYAAAADAGVIPFRRSSVNHWLSLPNKLFEYLAAGLPVVSVAFPELERIVTGYDVGRVCPPEDLDALAAAVRAVLDDPAELERLRANAARAAQELIWENEEPSYLAAVDRALTSR